MGAIAGMRSGSTRAIVSPWTAAQGVAHADAGAFFSGTPFPAHPAIAVAIGAAFAAASQNGPRRTSSSAANTPRRATRNRLG